MTQIHLTNSKSRRKELFEPLTPGKVGMYVCGPTVYDRAHLGNARSALAFDTLYRLLVHVYGFENVKFVRNFTDIDDKINARAAETGRTIRDITTETAQWYLDDMGALGVLEPNEMPRATEYVGQMIDMISELIEKGHAYAADGHVLFAVDTYDNYGALAGRSTDDMIAGARVEVATYKKNPMDFVLWKPSDADTPGWDSPWGRGRPGWHIECSAMARELLGLTFDIHGGGSDLKFPHHENEVAQSCCVNDAEFARFWLHNEMLQVEGKKMSKSLGNFFTVRDLLDQGNPGEVIRMVLLSTHYGKPMDWTQAKAAAARATLSEWHASVAQVPAGEIDQAAMDFLADDLNTAGFLSRLHELAKAKDWAGLKATANILNLLEASQTWWQAKDIDEATEALIKDIVAARKQAKVDRDFARSDALRDGLLAAGLEVADGPGGVTEVSQTPEFDPAKLAGIL